MSAVEARSRPLAGALVALFAAIALWNAISYEWVAGYDAAEHKEYADMLIAEGDLPRGTGEYYTPPGFYALAGGAEWLGGKIGLGKPVELAKVVNALLASAAAVLVFLLARELWPDRPRLALFALAFVLVCPIALKAAAMFHPETLSLLVSSVALLLAVRMLVRRSYGVLPAAALGAALGLAQLVRAFALWTVAVVLIGLAAAVLADRERRRAAVRALAVVAVVAAAVPAPWYLHQIRLYENPVFDRPQPEQPLWERRPASFYLDLGLPDLVTRPYRAHFSESFVPVLYSETWGDYFGVWAWGDAKGGDPDESARAKLGFQAVAGVVPTLLALTGWLALLALSIRHWRSRVALLVVSLLPLAGLAGLLYFTVSYPTPDGDTIKGLYMLTTLPAWALAFGLALDRLLAVRWLGRLVALLVVAAAVVSVPFAVYTWA